MLVGGKEVVYNPASYRGRFPWRRPHPRCADLDLASSKSTARSVSSSRAEDRSSWLPQPFKVLLLLLDRHGEVVSREEIQRHLWGESTFVDFERGINFSINQIRAALSDDAEKPRLIETLPKVGYRFVAEVIDAAGSEPVVHATQAVESRSGVRCQSQWSPIAPKAHAVRFPHIAVTAFLTAIALLAIGISLRKSSGSPNAIQSLAVLPLEDLSSDAADELFADGVTDQLITDLGQLAPLRVISRTSIMQYKRARRPLPDCPRAGRRCCRRGHHHAIGQPRPRHRSADRGAHRSPPLGAHLRDRNGGCPGPGKRTCGNHHGRSARQDLIPGIRCPGGSAACVLPRRTRI